VCIKKRKRNSGGIYYNMYKYNRTTEYKKQLISSGTQITDQLGVLLYTEKKIELTGAGCRLLYAL